jgi:hypothetical protein
MRRLHVIPLGRTTQAERREAAERTRALDELQEQPRPRTRGECQDGPRPCPWAGCRYHLLLDVTHAGSLKIHHDPESAAESCALDLADQGVTTLEAIGELMGITREAVRLIEIEALRKLNGTAMGGHR